MTNQEVDRSRPPTTSELTNAMGIQTKQRTRRMWTSEEDERLRLLVAYWGDQAGKNGHWDKISQHFENRTKKDCRKRWFHSLDPKLKRGKWTEHEDKVLMDAYEKLGPVWHRIAQLIPGRTDDQCWKRYNDVLDPKISDRLRPWTPEEDKRLLELVQKYGTKWRKISTEMEARTGLTCRNRWRKVVSNVVKEREKEKEKEKQGEVSSMLSSSLSAQQISAEAAALQAELEAQTQIQPQAAGQSHIPTLPPLASVHGSHQLPTQSPAVASAGRIQGQGEIQMHSNNQPPSIGLPVAKPGTMVANLSNVRESSRITSSSVSGSRESLSEISMNFLQTHQSQQQEQQPQSARSPFQYFEDIQEQQPIANTPNGGVMTRTQYVVGIEGQDLMNISNTDIQALVEIAAKAGQKIVIQQHNYHYHNSQQQQQQQQRQQSGQRYKNSSSGTGVSVTPATTPLAAPSQSFLELEGLEIAGTCPYEEFSRLDESDIGFDFEYHGIPFNPS